MTLAFIWLSCMLGCWFSGILIGYCIRDEIGRFYYKKRRASRRKEIPHG